jgi:hypothetical protein
MLLELAQAANEPSAAYQFGRILGIAVIVLIVVLVIGRLNR